jgi:hypothetical protein
MRTAENSRAIDSALGSGGVMESHAQKLNSWLTNSPFSVKKLKYGGYELILKREGSTQHICDFRSEDEANIWIRENGAQSGAAGSEI